MISRVKCSEFHSGALSNFGKSEFPLKIMGLTNAYDPSRQSAMNSDISMHQKTPMLAPKRNRTESQDANEQAHQLTRWQQEYTQLSGGRFYGCLDELVLEQVQVFQEFTNQALYQQCQIDKDSLWLGIPARDQLCRINGQAVQANRIMCRSGDEHFELMTPDSFAIYGLVVNRAALQQVAALQGLPLAVDRLVQQPLLLLPEGVLTQLRSLLDLWLAHQPQPQPQAARLQQDFIQTMVLQILQQEQPDDAPVGMTRQAQIHRQAVVRKVQSYVESHPQEVLTITQACAIAHVSRRTLQYSFESVLGVSPLQFLRCQRLNQVRRALLTGDAEQTVADTAARWGFWHAGQFGKDYKALFAEPPSATLAQGRRQRGCN